jgi:hypothetical protein
MTASTHTWLRRLSDYHSGGVSDTERAAIEEHLATCAECREALAMYRRFYTLLRSPLRLDAMNPRFDEPTMPMTITRRPAPPAWEPRTPPGRNRRTLGGLAAGLAAALIIASFAALVAPRLRTPVASSTPTPLASATAQATATSAQPTSSPPPGPGVFTCANPAGSSMVYAYVRASGPLAIVEGCQLRPTGLKEATFPLAWSPSNRYLAVEETNTAIPNLVAFVDPRTGDPINSPVSYTADFSYSPQVGDQAHLFFGWLDDNTFLGGVTTVTSNPQGFEQAGPTTLQRVNVLTWATTTIGHIGGWANIGSAVGVYPRMAGHGRYLYYAGYDTAGTQAYLHRFDVTTGTDTRLVSLGLYTRGGCQTTPLCGWTTWWDVSRDGAHILYHNPGASSAPGDADAGAPKDTPVLYANPDGSGASQLFGSQLAAALVAPVFAPNGQLAIECGIWGASSNPVVGDSQIRIATVGGGLKTISGQFSAWRGDSAALVVRVPGAQGGTPAMELYDLTTGATTPLEPGSNWYLWGNAGAQS